MKTKNLVLSLIFPVICAVSTTVLLLVNIGSSHTSQRILAFIMEVCAIFPLVSVIFLKTDISGMIKWQIMFTAAAAGSLLFYILLATSDVLFVGAYLFGIVAPVVIIAACGAIYGAKLKKESGRRVLKWFTAFFSNPAVYYSAYFMAVFIPIFFYRINPFANFG